MLTLADFDFDLPPELIAQAALPGRSASRLMVVHEDSQDDRHVRDLPNLLRAQIGQILAGSHELLRPSVRQSWQKAHHTHCSH